MRSVFFIFVCVICVFSVDMNASVPDTLSVLAFKQYGQIFLNEYYCIISDSTLSDNERASHDSILICDVFENESVVYNHGHLSGLMRLNALSDSVQNRMGCLFAKQVGDDRCYAYDREYLIKPYFINENLAVYELVYTSFREELPSDSCLNYVYIDKRNHLRISIEDVLKKNRSGLNKLLQRYLLSYLNGVSSDLKVLKIGRCQNIERLGEVAVYGFTASYMLCVFNSSLITNGIDRLVLQIPLREVKPFLSKSFLRILL